ncbi:hypothetical protein GQR36_07630 [Enterococcus termitis]
MEELALPLLKANLGISKDNRDAYLLAILKSIVSELTNEKVCRSMEQTIII